MLRLISFFIKIILSFILVSTGLAENTKNEILVESDSMHIDELQSISTFNGNVVLKYGELSLLSDKVVISKKNNNISIIQAFGSPASFKIVNKSNEYNEIIGNSDEILYNSEDQTILLIGNANIESIENSISAHSVLFNLSTKSINLKSNSNSSSERVKVKINQ